MQDGLRQGFRWAGLTALACAMAASFADVQAQAVGGSGAAAASVGRPAIAGAQGGLGAQAGLPQGGLGTQGNEAAQVRLPIRRPGQQPEDFPQGQPAAGSVAGAAAGAVRSETIADPDVTPKQKRDTARRVTRTAKGTVPAVR